jgi:catechol 2,3-dioxygenase-like lactoylglutathione lyase family enzyme
MLHHVSVGVVDVERAARFYDAILGALGVKRVMEFLPHAVAYGEGAAEFWVQLPHDQKQASPGNGAHVGFAARNRKAVDDFHAAALEAGAMDEGAPGPRPDYSPEYYGAFVRDPDGNKLEALFFATAKAKPAKVKTRAKAAAKPARAAPKAKAGAKARTARAATKKKAAPKRKAAAKAKSPSAARRPAARRPVARRGARGRPAKR